MTMTLDLLNHPRIHLETDGARHVLRYDMQGWGSDLRAYYWQEPRPTDLDPRQSWDSWRYLLPPETENTFGHPFSHVSQQGCEIMIARHLVEKGYLAPNERNEHLDEKNMEIAGETIRAWNARTGKPRVGDFVIMPNGTKRRCSHAWDDGMQTSDGGSYYVSTSGGASMSGSLYPSQLWEYFKDTGEVEPGRFWFFSHGLAGAGRGVDFYMPCRVYRLEPFAMTEGEARAHPSAKSAADFWGENDRGHLEAISKLMNPAALNGGYY